MRTEALSTCHCAPTYGSGIKCSMRIRRSSLAPSEPQCCSPHVFLGGADLEMSAIRSIALEALGPAHVSDHGLSWGAKASSYHREITAALEQNETPVLVELTLDLPASIPRGRLADIDHHGHNAGAGRPCALRQMFRLLGLPSRRWTREMTLIEANDIGHIRGLRRVGATMAEIVAIRNCDRAAQGVNGDVEVEARRAIADAQVHGVLTVIVTASATSSAVADFVQPEYGGPGADNLLVLMPGGITFYGHGGVIEKLKDIPGSWRGGELPEFGFWSISQPEGPDYARLVEHIRALATFPACQTLPATTTLKLPTRQFYGTRRWRPINAVHCPSRSSRLRSRSENFAK